MTRRRQDQPPAPPEITELEKAFRRKNPNYDELVAASTEIIMARIAYREHHLRALLILGRSLLARNQGNDLNDAVRRLQQAHNLALQIAGSTELIFRTGCYLAVGMARQGDLGHAVELLRRMARFISETDADRRTFFDEQQRLVGVWAVAA
jgi:hypothetical protein